MGVFKLGGMTLGSLFKKPETLLYPVQVKEPAPGLKGHIAIKEEDCILCGLCQRSCVTGAITVSKQERVWSIDRLRCIQCGYCTHVCPKKCLRMDPSYAPATMEKTNSVFPIPEQEKPKKTDSD